MLDCGVGGFPERGCQTVVVVLGVGESAASSPWCVAVVSGCGGGSAAVSGCSGLKRLAVLRMTSITRRVSARFSSGVPVSLQAALIDRLDSASDISTSLSGSVAAICSSCANVSSRTE